MNQQRWGDDPQAALADYLDQLLHDEPAEETAESEAAEPDHRGTAQAAAGTVSDAPPSEHLPEALNWSDAVPEAAEELTHEAAFSVQLPCGRVEPDDGRHYRFTVAGLTVAIPAVRVRTEQAFEGQPEGPGEALVRPVRLACGKTVQVVDLARLMLPPSSGPLDQPLEARAGTLVLLDEGEWGLAGDRPGELEALEESEICWRGEHGSRPWLAGVIASRRLAVLDLDQLAGMLP